MKGSSIVFFILFFSAFAFAQEDVTQISASDKEDRKAIDNPFPTIPEPLDKNPAELTVKTEKDKSEWVFAPVPGYNPAQGWTLALALQRIYTQDEKSQPSIFGGAVAVTEKKSYAAAAAWLGRLREDRLKIFTGGGYGKLMSDFYGIGKVPSNKENSILLEQEATFFALQVMPKIGPVFVGANILYVDLTNKFDLPSLPADIPPAENLHDSFWAPGLRIQWDTRDNYMYPNEGYLLEATVQMFDENWSGNHTYQRYNLDANGFYDIADLFVLGLRAHIESGRGDVPFYAMPSFGGSDLRGYKYGKYRDKNMWATQAEARYRFTQKWGGVAFAGIGNVMSSFDKEGFVDPLSSGGVGVRYRIADKNPLDFRVDVAYGDDEVSWYFSVGQAFP